jgi:hypothetical protein
VGSSSALCFDQTCILNNVCVDENLQLEVYSDQPLNIPVKLELMAAKQDYYKKGEIDVLTVVQKPLSTFPSGVSFIEEQVYAQQLHAMGNFGHAILQNCLPMFQLVVKTHGRLAVQNPFQVMLFNNCTNCGIPSSTTCDNGHGSFGYSSCEFMKNQLYELLSGNPPIDFYGLLQSRKTDRICFKSFVAGMGPKYDMLSPSDLFELDLFLKEVARNKVYRSMAASMNFPDHKVLNVVVYCKTTGRHGAGISNCDFPAEIIRKKYANSYGGRKVVVRLINFDHMPNMTAQFEVISKANVYLTSGGSASYYSIFLRKGAVALVMPLCNHCVCSESFLYARNALDVVYQTVDPMNVLCPTQNCNRWDCFGQNIGLVDSFEQDLSAALEQASKNLSK